MYKPGPGTTHAYHGLFAEEVHLATRSITKGSVLSNRRQGQFSELFRHHSPGLVNALRMRSQMDLAARAGVRFLRYFLHSDFRLQEGHVLFFTP
jgi:hypothetical protein